MPNEFVVPGENLIVSRARRGEHRRPSSRAHRRRLRPRGLVGRRLPQPALSDLAWTMARWAEGPHHVPLGHEKEDLMSLTIGVDSRRRPTPRRPATWPSPWPSSTRSSSVASSLTSSLGDHSTGSNAAELVRHQLRGDSRAAALVCVASTRRGHGAAGRAWELAYKSLRTTGWPALPRCAARSGGSVAFFLPTDGIETAAWPRPLSRALCSPRIATASSRRAT